MAGREFKATEKSVLEYCYPAFPVQFSKNNPEICSNCTL